MSSTATEPLPLRPAYHTSAPAQHDAMHAATVVAQRGARAWMRFSGARAAEALNGLLTNEVASLAPGHGCYAAALTPKGRILADVVVHREADDLLVEVPGPARDHWQGMIRKFVNPRLASWRVVDDEVETSAVYGAGSRHLLEQLTGAQAVALGALPPHGTMVVQPGPPGVVITRLVDTSAEGYLVRSAPGDALHAALAAAVVDTVPLDAWHVARVEQGWPWWGADIDDTTIPQEANLDELGGISYTKGCYTGQEVVARIHFRGHVNRRLTGLHAPSGQPLLPLSPVLDASGKTVGDIRSAARSPRLGEIALAMLRREVAVGDQVTVRTAEGDVIALVRALPFTA
jgi:tRNA-modifying protein YgfZ